MTSPFLTDEAKTALLAAVRDLESRSSAEVVIAVRPRSASYLQADLLAGIVAGSAVMALLLFLPQAFDLVWFLFDPILAGALAAFLVSSSPGTRRALTPLALRRSWAETMARALFVERRVHGTAGRTGVLLFISLLEREAVVVADLGVEAAFAAQPARQSVWNDGVAALEAAVRRGADGVAASARLSALGEPLAAVLPCLEDDVNELADEVDGC